MESRQLNFKLNSELYIQFQEVSKKYGMSMTFILRRLVLDFLKANGKEGVVDELQWSQKEFDYMLKEQIDSLTK